MNSKNSKAEKLTKVVMKYNLWQKLPGLFRMFSATINGRYKPKISSILIGLVTIIYVLSPIDLIPEFLFGPLGLTDDLTIFIFGLNKIFNEVERFLNWENNNNNKNTDTYYDADAKIIK